MQEDEGDRRSYWGYAPALFAVGLALVFGALGTSVLTDNRNQKIELSKINAFIFAMEESYDVVALKDTSDR